MPNFPFTVGDSLRIGTADITASGGNIVLPSGTQVGNQPVATTVEVSTGGGPKITNIQVTSNVYVVLDDTAVDTAGGFIKITGTNFVTGCMVYVASTPANSTTFVNSTEVRAAVPATSAGTYPLYLVNPDGGTAIRVPGLTFSANPAWQTASTLPEQYDGVAINLSLVATEATLYTLVSGSLPPGLSLNGNTGVISGTVSGVANDTVYSFTVTATDAQLQDSPRTFTVTVTVSDPYFKLTSLLLSGSAISANTVIRDSSTNNFNLTVYGDSRASNFTPYGTGWSVYFDGTGDYLQVPYSTANDLGTGGNWTVELWVYMPSILGDALDVIGASNGGGDGPKWFIAINMNTSFAYTANRVGFYTWLGAHRWLNVAYTWTAGTWYHIAATYDSTNTTLYVNGQSVGSQAYNSASSAGGIRIGSDGEAYKYFTGYISNCRVVKGTAVYTANFTPATTNLTAVANTSLLTCNANRFLDASTNNFAITRNGDARVVSFNPFNITNTGVNGSAYFDGTGDYLTVAGNSGFAFGTGDFTIECWVNPDLINTATFDRICATSNYNGTGFDLTLNNGAAGLFLAGTSYGISSIPIKAWSHLVYTRSGTTVRGFLNGKLSSHTTGASQDISSTATLFIAHQGHAAGGSMLTGYLADLRLIKGSIPAAYQTASTTVGTQIFTPPTLALTAITNTQLLTLQYDQPHNNHTFLDSSSNQFLLTRYGNATQGSFSPFSQNGWSVYFNGNTGNYLTVSGGILGTSSNTFTIECWVYRLSNTYGMLFGDAVPTSYTNYWSFEVNSSNLLNFYWFDGGTKNVTGNTTIPINTWTHLALSVNNNAISLYVNGIQQTLSGTTTLTNRSGSNGYITIGQHGSPAVAYNGYISNLSFLSGTAKYSATFTPSSTKLLTNTINQQLLVCYGNNFNDFNTATSAKSISVTGTPQVQAFSPFAPTAVYSPVAHGGSAYFDGSGDYLNFTDTANILDMGGIAASVEAWVYPLGNSGNHHIISKSGGDPNWSTTNGIYWIMRIVTGQFGCEFRNGTVVNVITGGTATLNTWHHVAIATDTSNNIALFVNGVRVGTATNAITKPTSRTLIQIADFAGASVAVNAYISGICFKTSTSAYAPTSSTIIIPTAPVTAATNTQLLLNFTDSAIIDSTGRNVLETAGDAKVTTIQTKFGTSSQFYNGSNTNLVVPVQPYFSFPGTTSFTVEAWVYFNDLNTQIRPLITLGDGANGSGPIYMAWSIRYMGTEGSNQINWGRYDGTSYDYSTSGLNLVANTWYHIAVSRDSSNTLRIFVNGTSYYSATVTQTFAQINSNPLRIGLSYNGPQTGYGGPRYFNGYIDGIRITQGYARYTANFTAPTAPARLK